MFECIGAPVAVTSYDVYCQVRRNRDCRIHKRMPAFDLQSSPSVLLSSSSAHQQLLQARQFGRKLPSEHSQSLIAESAHNRVPHLEVCLLFYLRSICAPLAGPCSLILPASGKVSQLEGSLQVAQGIVKEGVQAFVAHLRAVCDEFEVRHFSKNDISQLLNVRPDCVAQVVALLGDHHLPLLAEKSVQDYCHRIVQACNIHLCPNPK